MKIKNRIIVSFLLAFLVILTGVALVTGFYTIDLVKKNSYAYLTASNRARAEHIRTFLQDQKKTADILAAGVVYRQILKEPVNSPLYPGLKKEMDKRLARNIASDPMIEEAFVLDAAGKIIASSDLGREGLDKSQDNYFVFAKEQAYIKDVYFSSTTHGVSYTISSPVKGDDGAFLGVSVLRYSPENFFSIVKSENGLGETEENFLINKDKFFLTPSIFLGNDVVLKKKVETKNAAECFDPAEVTYVKQNGYAGFLKTFGSQIVLNAVDYRNKAVVATHAYIPETGWCLITKVDEANLLSFRTTLVIAFFIIFIVAGLIFTILSFLISNKITTPIFILQDAIKKIKQGKLEYNVKINSKDELESLSEEFSEMVAAVKRSRADVDLKVKDQTKELKKTKEELELKLVEAEKFNKLVVDREGKMMELKARIAELEGKLKTDAKI